MEWAALLLPLALALVLVVGLALARARREAGERPASRGSFTQRRHRRPSTDDPDLTPEDEEELARGFAAIQREETHTLEALLDLRLQLVHSRGVPLRAIRAAPGPHTGRLVFADSTVILVRARRPGELYLLALSIPDHAICLGSWSQEPDGTVLRFAWPPDGSSELVVIGLDQAD